MEGQDTSGREDMRTNVSKLLVKHGMSTRQAFLNDLCKIIAARDQRIADEARLSQLNKLCDIYNLKFEPNGEFRSFGSLKPEDIADFFLAVGVEIRQIEARLNTSKKGGE